MAKVDGQRGLSEAALRAKGWNPIEWFGGVKQEFNKITWTGREELKACTKVTVFATFAIGLGLYLTDLFIQSGLTAIASLVRAFIS
jgi:preprotein translocase SecE subunit